MVHNKVWQWLSGTPEDYGKVTIYSNSTDKSHFNIL